MIYQGEFTDAAKRVCDLCMEIAEPTVNDVLCWFLAGFFTYWFAFKFIPIVYEEFKKRRNENQN